MSRASLMRLLVLRGVFAVGIAADQRFHLLDRFLGLALIAVRRGHTVEIGRRDDVLRLRRILGSGMDGEVAPRGGHGFRLLPGLLIGDGGHQHRLLRLFRIGIELIEPLVEHSGFLAASLFEQFVRLFIDHVRRTVIELGVAVAAEHGPHGPAAGEESCQR